MVRNSAIILLFAFSLFTMVGCEHELKDDPNPERLVTISFTAKSMSGSLLKSAASPAEDLIEKIILFSVDRNDAVENYTIINNPTFSDSSLIISQKVKSFYAIANPSAELETAIENSPPDDVSDLMNLVDDFTNAPQSPFLMSCMKEIDKDNINLEFIRAVAKIDITNIDGFQIESVTVNSTPNKGFAFNSTSVSVPASASMTSYSTITSTTPTLYVAENSNASPTQFVITGKFQGKQEAYIFSLKSGGSDISIKRNTCYQVSIGFEYEVP